MTPSIQLDFKSRIQSSTKRSLFQSLFLCKTSSWCARYLPCNFNKTIQNASTGQVLDQLLTAPKEAQLMQWLTELTSYNVPTRVSRTNNMANTILRT